jgi:P27 family predicted phage terminase small subunit
MRGRKGDGAAVKAAKQSAFKAPAKPKRKKVKLRSPEERAQILAAIGGAGADSLAPPQFLAESEEFDGALDVWRQLAPDLTRINALTNLDRYTFAMYCVHMADWLDAVRDIAEKGAHYIAKNVNRDPIWRLNPAVKVREYAEAHLMDIGERFGLNPAARYKLLRDESLISKQLGLFSDREPAPPGAPAKESDTGEDPTGLMERLGGRPPALRPN